MVNVVRADQNPLNMCLLAQPRRSNIIGKVRRCLGAADERIQVSYFRDIAFIIHEEHVSNLCQQEKPLNMHPYQAPCAAPGQTVTDTR